MNSSLTQLEHEILALLSGTDIHLNASIIAKRITSTQHGMRTTKRIVPDVVRSLLSKGIPICKSGKGYFYARTEKQLRKYITKIDTESFELAEETRWLNKSYDKVGHILMGQIIGEDGVIKSGPIVKQMITKAVRTPGGVAMREFEVGTDGQPIIPEGIEIIN